MRALFGRPTAGGAPRRYFPPWSDPAATGSMISNPPGTDRARLMMRHTSPPVGINVTFLLTT